MGNYHVVDRCDFQPGQIINGQYMVRKTLGEGSFGVVYLVEDSRKSKFALKLLRLWEVPSEVRQSLIDRFEMEFKTGQIASANLVQSLSYGTVGGNPFIVMEFCPGGDLTPLLGKADSQASRICQEVLSGLQALHSHGKVHRDLKPENVLFKQNGMAALTDFGIAGDRTHRLTQCNFFGRPNQIFGTYAYMPPEQVSRVRGGATVKFTTDIFSFGVMAYQLLTGELPFGSLESHNELAKYQSNGKKGIWNKDLLHHVPDSQQWIRTIEACLVPNYKDRVQTIKEVMTMIPLRTTAINSQNNPVPSHDSRPAQQIHGYRLQIMQGEEYGKIYDLTDMLQRGVQMFTLGRHCANTIYIKSEFSDYLSRFHCTIEPDTGQWKIRDGQWRDNHQCWVDSTNGTFVNSRPITANGFYLKSGDIIAMGDVTLRFENY